MSEGWPMVIVAVVLAAAGIWFFLDMVSLAIEVATGGYPLP